MTALTALHALDLDWLDVHLMTRDAIAERNRELIESFTKGSI